MKKNIGSVDHGLADLTRKGVKLVDVTGAGQLGLWEDLVGRAGVDRLCGWALVGELAAAGLLTARTEHVEFEAWNREALDSGLLLDVRNASEFEIGHLDGAVNIAYTRLAEVPGGRRLFIHCGSGKRASLAASFLLTEGFDAVHVDGTCSKCERIAQTDALTH